MARGKAEDAGGLTPAKDDNAAPYHFAPRTLPIFKCVDYTGRGGRPDCSRRPPYHAARGPLFPGGAPRRLLLPPLGEELSLIHI